MQLQTGMQIQFRSWANRDLHCILSRKPRALSRWSDRAKSLRVELTHSDHITHYVLTSSLSCRQVGAAVLRVFATDRDAGQNSAVIYDITSGNEQQAFALDGDTGVVRLRQRLDFDRLSEYRLVVRATDRDRVRPLSALAAVHIRVSDENDNAPRFPQPVYHAFAAENAPAGQLVFTAHANDADRGRYGRLNYTLTDGADRFKVDAATGQVTTAAVFDYEQRELYTFTISAADPGGRTATATVRVAVRGCRRVRAGVHRETVPVPCAGRRSRRVRGGPCGGNGQGQRRGWTGGVPSARAAPVLPREPDQR